MLCDYCCPAAAAQACQVECPGGAVVVRLAPEGYAAKQRAVRSECLSGLQMTFRTESLR